MTGYFLNPEFLGYKKFRPEGCGIKPHLKIPDEIFEYNKRWLKNTKKLFNNF